MARKKQRVIPVENRTMKRQRPARKKRQVKLQDWQVFVSVLVLVTVVVLLRAPLANYMEQRAEIQRLETEIAAQKEQKEQLQEEISRYNDEAYVREQARARLGVIEPGETAYRVLDPALTDGDASASQEDQVETEYQKWYNLLWDSVSVAEEEEETEATPAAGMEMPLAPLE